MANRLEITIPDPDERYSVLLNAIAGHEALDPAKDVIATTQESETLKSKILNLCNLYDEDGPLKQRLQNIETYHHDLLSLHRLLHLETIRVTDFLTFVQSARLPSFIDFDEEDFRLLRAKAHKHRKYIVHILCWRNEVVYAVRDGMSAGALTMLYSLEGFADGLSQGRLDEAEQHQQTIRVNAIEYYMAGQPWTEEEREEGFGEAEIWLWCPVTKLYHAPSHMIVTHIIPAKTPLGTISDAFGEYSAGGLLGSRRNVLLLHYRVAMAFNNGQITLVPVSYSNKELRVLLLDRSLVEGNKPIHSFQMQYKDGTRKLEWETWTTVADSPQLEFKNDSRPGHRNLFFHCVGSLRKAKGAGYIGLAGIMEDFAQRRIWQNPGHWLEDTILKGWADSFLMPQLYRKDATFVKNPKLDKLEGEFRALAAAYEIDLEKQEEENQEQEWDCPGLVHYDRAVINYVLSPYFFPDEYYYPQTLLPLSPESPHHRAMPFPTEESESDVSD